MTTSPDGATPEGKERMVQAAETILTPKLGYEQVWHFRNNHADGFDFRTYNANLDMLRERSLLVEALFGVDARKIQDGLLHPIADRARVIQAIKLLEKAPLASQTLVKLMPETLIMPPVPDIKEMTTFFNTFFANSHHDVVTLASTHTAANAELSALIDIGINPQDVGIIILDAHFDAQPSRGIFKSTFLQDLIQKGYTNLAVIGLPDTDYDRYMNRHPGEASESIYDIIKRTVTLPHLDSIKLHCQGEYFQGSSVDQKILGGIIYSTLQRFSNSGIKHIVLQIDIDSLDTWRHQISPAPYSHYTKVQLAGMVDIASVEDARGATFRGIREQYGTGRWSLGKAIREFHMLNGTFLDALTHPANHPNSIIKGWGIHDSRYKHLMQGAEGWGSSLGFSPNNIRFIVDTLRQLCAEGNLQFGVPIGAHLYLGGIYEMQFEDINGNTARLARDIVRNMTRPL